jgi:hypothetical protein
MDSQILREYRYHRANGGTARGSLACARARRLLDRAVDLEIGEVRWEDELESYEDVFGFGDDTERKQFYEDLESNTITGPFWCALFVNGENVASLGMTMLGPRETDDYYAKLVEVELAMDAENDLRQAIGDELDSRMEGMPMANA